MIAVVSAQLADLFTFLLVIQHRSIEGEVNPLARFAFVSAGTPGIVLLKLASLGLLLVLLWTLRHQPRLSKIGSHCIVIVGMVGALSNTLAGMT